MSIYSVFFSVQCYPSFKYFSLSNLPKSSKVALLALTIFSALAACLCVFYYYRAKRKNSSEADDSSETDIASQLFSETLHPIPSTSPSPPCSLQPKPLEPSAELPRTQQLGSHQGVVRTDVKWASLVAAEKNLEFSEESTRTQQQLALQTLQRDPTLFQTYFDQGIITPTIKPILWFVSGTAMWLQRLYLEMIQLAPNDTQTYLKLGGTLQANDALRLLDGTLMTQQKLYLKAIECGSKLTLLKHISN